MSKGHRGTGIRDQFNNGRAECPVCKRTAIKCLYEKEIDGAKVKGCKACNAKLSKSVRFFPTKTASLPGLIFFLFNLLNGLR